jgi:hypothetical protein
MRELNAFSHRAWATLDEATTLVGMTTNKIGKARDLSVLGAVRLALKL